MRPLTLGSVLFACVLMLATACSEGRPVWPDAGAKGGSSSTGDSAAGSGGVASGGTSSGGVASGGTSSDGGTTANGGTTTATGGAAPSTDSGVTPGTRATFPLKLSPSGRHLVGDNGVPFLIKEISAWGLIQALSEEDAEDFMDEVSSRGFNTLMVSAISSDARFAGGPPQWNGTSPFTVEWDFSTPNPAYFAHVDRVLAAAEKRGMLVLLVPCYLGFTGDVTQGFWLKLQDPRNSPAKSEAYGRFLGQRYAKTPNIVWEAGGDNSASGATGLHLTSIVQGIRAVDDAHLWTGHFDAGGGDNWSTDNEAFAEYIDLDGLYAWTESQLGSRGPQYVTELAQRRKGKLIFQLDQSYEQDAPHVTDNETPWIRRKNYDGLLSGCAGTSFSPGTRDNQLYSFKNWRPLMNTAGMKEATICLALFDSRDWPSLVPDEASDFVVAGRGTFGSVDYVCAARTERHETAIAYIPSAHPISVDLGAVSGTEAILWWYSPTTGDATRLGTYPTEGEKELIPPGSGDWVLVMDDASAKLTAPGVLAR